MKSARISVLFLLIAALVLFSSCSPGGSGEPREFTIALTGYLMGQIDPCNCPGNPLGGYARRAGVMEREFSDLKGVIQLDAGKWVSLSPERGELDSRITAAMFAELGVDAINLTMRDARLGKQTLLAWRDQYDLSFLSANLMDAETNKPLFPATKQITVEFEDGGSMDVAVIGVCRAGSANYMDPTTGLTFVDAGPELVKAYDKVRDAPCVVLLTDADRSIVADWLALLEGETGTRPDIVLSSNLHPTRSARILIGQTPMATAGRQGKYLDLVHAIPLEQGGWDVRKEGVPLNEQAPEDERMIAIINDLAGDTETAPH